MPTVAEPFCERGCESGSFGSNVAPLGSASLADADGASTPRHSRAYCRTAADRGGSIGKIKAASPPIRPLSSRQACIKEEQSSPTPLPPGNRSSHDTVVGSPGHQAAGLPSGDVKVETLLIEMRVMLDELSAQDPPASALSGTGRGHESASRSVSSQHSRHAGKRHRTSDDVCTAGDYQQQLQLEVQAASLRREVRRLEAANTLLRAGLTVFPASFTVVDEALSWLVATRVAFSKQAEQLLYREAKGLSSFLRVPPPSEWTSGWIQHFRTMPPSHYRFYLQGAYEQLQAILREPNRTRAVQDLSMLNAKRHSLTSFLMSCNPMAVVMNASCNIHTGEYEDTTKKWPAIARNTPIHLMRPGGLSKLRTAHMVYMAAIAALTQERQALKFELAQLTAAQQQPQGHVAGHVRALPHLQEQQGQTDGASYDGPGPVGASPREALQDAVLPQADLYLTIDEALARIEKTFSREVHERMRLMHIFFADVVTPICGAHLVVAAYPHVLTVPLLVKCILEYATQPDVLGLLAKTAPWVLVDEDSVRV